MKNGVKFSDKHSIDDWDLLMTNKIIGEAEPKIIDVEIPGSDGKKDLTEAFGEIRYNNRILSFDFEMFQNTSDWWELKRKITNYLHGKRHKITLDTDDEFYYLGRCQITSFTHNQSVARLTIDCDCFPYKYKKEVTINSQEVLEGNTYSYFNLSKKVVPFITTDSEITIEFEGTQFSLSEGTHKALGIIFKEGMNNISIISGSGHLTLEYQEATL